MRSPIIFTVSMFILLAFSTQHGRAAPNPGPGFRTQFLQLCDLAAATLNKTNNRASSFVDSYAVRSLCAAYDLTGEAKYLDACRKWSAQMVKYQEKMTPIGAYYMHYNRKPGQTNGDWYVADSSSIGMALLATSVRCQGGEKERLLDSTRKFASLVMSNYVSPDGGVSDGIWHESKDSWWCSSALFGSFLFNLYANTGDKQYLNTGLSISDWLNHWDLTKKQPFPLSQQGPAMLMYIMEFYSVGWSYLSKDDTREKASLAKVSWCLNWITDQQQAPVKHTLLLSLRQPRTLTKPQPTEKVIMQGPWPISKGWGMKLGGLPFHEYIFSQYLPDGEELMADGDAELQRLTQVVFARKPEFNQLSVFMMMSYAERLNPGAIYRSANTHTAMSQPAIRGLQLQKMVLSRCEHIAYRNRPYEYNGVGDCYGYCRQVWNAILSDGQEHAEDYAPNQYDQQHWLDSKSGIPVNTAPDTNWVQFSSPDVLLPGDLLATHQGHMWGPNWHGGIYAGNGENWDCSKHSGLNGAYKRPLFSGFHYYYKPLHDLLSTDLMTSNPLTVGL